MDTESDELVSITKWTHIAGDTYATRAHRHGDLYPKFFTRRAVGDESARVRVRGGGDGETGDVGTERVDGDAGVSEFEV